MTATTGANLGLQHTWASGENGWNTGMDANLIKLDTIVQLAVNDSTLSSPPGSPVDGSRYVVNGTGSGGWAGLDNRIVLYKDSAWTSYVPKEGWLVHDNNSNTYKKFDGSSWVSDPLGDRAYADSLVTGLWNDRGNYNASGGAYPSSGGSGTAGAIKKGDIWTISVAGTLPTGQVVEAGDTVRALVNTPGNTQANWAIAQNNIGYTPESSANKSTDGAMTSNSTTLYPSQSAVVTYVGTQIGAYGLNNTQRLDYFEDFVITNNSFTAWTGSLQVDTTAINLSSPSAPLSYTGASNTMGWMLAYNSLISTGQVASVRHAGFSSTNALPADCKKEAVMGVVIESLPTNTSTTDAVLRYGLLTYNFINAADPLAQTSAAAYFQADKDGFWKCCSGKTGANETTTTAVALAADTLVALNVCIAANGVVTFYINGTLVATHNTGLCNFAQPYNLCYQIYNQGAGNLASSTTGVGASAFDYWGVRYVLSAARTNAAFITS